MHALPFALLAVPLLAAAALAQPVTVQARALTNLSAAAQAGGMQNGTVLPAGTTLVDNTVVRATVSGLNPSSIALASTSIRIFREPNRIEYRIVDFSLAFQPPVQATAGSTGSHETLLSFQLASGIPAKLQLEWSGTTSGLASVVPGEVDVFNDGIVDFIGATPGATGELRGLIGPRTIDVRTRTGSGATAQNGLAFARGDLLIRMVPDTRRSVDMVLSGCGSQLILEPTFDGDVDAVYALPPGAPGILVGGFATAPLTGPPLACLFLPRPDAIAVLDPTRTRLPLGLNAIRLPVGPVYFQGLSIIFGQVRPTTSWTVTSR